MLAQEHKSFLDYIKKGRLPGSFGSTKSNFIRTSKSMTVNKKGELLRNKKFIVKRSERDAIFQGNFSKFMTSTNLSISQGAFGA